MVEIDYEEWVKKLKQFKLYFEGYVRGSASPIKKLTNLYAELEEVVFGEARTKSWNTPF